MKLKASICLKLKASGCMLHTEALSTGVTLKPEVHTEALRLEASVCLTLQCAGCRVQVLGVGV